MNDLFSFEATPFELACQGLRFGDSIDALRLLNLLEGEDEEAVEEAFAALLELGVDIRLDSLPQSQASDQLQTRLGRPFVDWNKVEQILEMMNVLPPTRTVYRKELEPPMQYK